MAPIERSVSTASLRALYVITMASFISRTTMYRMTLSFLPSSVQSYNNDRSAHSSPCREQFWGTCLFTANIPKVGKINDAAALDHDLRPMHPFASYVLRNYYKATGWNEDNLYANLTRSSNCVFYPLVLLSIPAHPSLQAILDFTIPHGLHLSVSKSPNPLFKTSYSMTAMPSLQGSVAYIFTSCDLDIQSSRSVRFKHMVDRFRVYDQPRRPEPKEEVWLAGERVDTRGAHSHYSISLHLS